MSHFITLIKSNLIKQTKRYPFYIIVGISIFAGFLCVPGKFAGYAIFDMGNVRGIYNSSWLGILGAILPVILLWLPGFYLLRNQITEDGDLKIGQIIAASPISNSRYIYGKLAANFSVLVFLQVIFLIAFMAMQLIHKESMYLSLGAYIIPFLLISIPYLLVLAALTVLFDTLPFLKGAFGNIVIFILWTVLITMSFENPGGPLDLFEMGTLVNEMGEGARAYFPSVPRGGSFGYYPVATDLQTFPWDGIAWSRTLILSRLIWVLIAFAITQLSILAFHRFKEVSKSRKSKEITVDQPITSKHGFQTNLMLSNIVKTKKLHLPTMIFSEIKIMLLGHPLWWYLSVVAVIVLVPFVTSREMNKWLSLSMLLPISIWAQMGNKEKSEGTLEFIISSCPPFAKWVTCWISGIIVSMLMSIGILVSIIVFSHWSYLVPWLVGSIFVPTLALVLGIFSNSPRLFEAVFITLLYFGPIQGMWKLDFMGLTSNNVNLYLLITAFLCVLGMILLSIRKKRGGYQ